ncbi:MAG: hypothetical protein KC618_06125 [Candidatus Omnitrophica bacterium]|nr:hypothetical protein [Candidatus Omnitrophota bacterium]
MVVFDLWAEAFIFSSVYAILIIIPCILVAIMGRKLIDKLGQYPTRAPLIHMEIFFKMIILEVLTFGSIIVFYLFFQK